MGRRRSFVASGPADHLERLPLLVLVFVYIIPLGGIWLDLAIADRVAVLAFVVAMGAWLVQRHREVLVGRDGLLIRSALLRAETFVPYEDVESVWHEQRSWSAGLGVVRMRCHHHRPEAFVFGSLYAASGNTPEAMVEAVERAMVAEARRNVPAALAQVHARGDDFEAWFEQQRRRLVVGRHREAGVDLVELWAHALEAPTTPLQRALVAWVACEEGTTLSSPGLEAVALETAHPLAALTFEALARGHWAEAREGLECLWCDEGCGDAVAVPHPT